MAIEEDPPAGVPEWVVTFGDMMSLLLTFFIMLVSMSEIKQDDAKFRAFTESLRERFGDDIEKMYLGFGTGQPAATKPTKKTTKRYTKWDNSTDQGSKVKAPPGNQQQVRNLRPGGQVMVGGALYFDEASADLNDANKHDLERTVEQLQGKPQRIEIRGHTSRRPLPADSPFKDNWDLAYARCRVVNRFLVEQGVDPRRIRLSVAADNEPVQLGADPLLLKENSRVEVFMVGEVPSELFREDGESTAPPEPKPASPVSP